MSSITCSSADFKKYFIEPYFEGFAKVKSGFTPAAMIADSAPSLLKRVALITEGLLLMIPLINTIVILVKNFLITKGNLGGEPVSKPKEFAAQPESFGLGKGNLGGDPVSKPKGLAAQPDQTLKELLSTFAKSDAKETRFSLTLQTPIQQSEGQVPLTMVSVGAKKTVGAAGIDIDIYYGNAVTSLKVAGCRFSLKGGFETAKVAQFTGSIHEEVRKALKQQLEE